MRGKSIPIQEEVTGSISKFCLFFCFFLIKVNTNVLKYVKKLFEDIFTRVRLNYKQRIIISPNLPNSFQGVLNGCT